MFMCVVGGRTVDGQRAVKTRTAHHPRNKCRLTIPPSGVRKALGVGKREWEECNMLVHAGFMGG